ncbi:hypothetical protein B0T22DRAFT_441821 [Podospora appendiculata]|uniref:Protein kinase domain-containing protein n=1 Tax=Podospora appendiculata TaxID=314037 RepID=A0AAE0XDD2_9PEZI|nr:hypothetical protein B0T22DRAFT_441821 [Podospora appendiculata]
MALPPIPTVHLQGRDRDWFREKRQELTDCFEFFNRGIVHAWDQAKRESAYKKIKVPYWGLWKTHHNNPFAQQPPLVGPAAMGLFKQKHNAGGNPDRVTIPSSPHGKNIEESLEKEFNLYLKKVRDGDGNRVKDGVVKYSLKPDGSINRERQAHAYFARAKHIVSSVTTKAEEERTEKVTPSKRRRRELDVGRRRAHAHGLIPIVKIADLGLAEPMITKMRVAAVDMWLVRKCGKRGGFYAPEQFHPEWNYIHGLPALELRLTPTVAGRYSWGTNLYWVGLIMWSLVTLHRPPRAPHPYHSIPVVTTYDKTKWREHWTYGGYMYSDRWKHIDAELRRTIAACMSDVPEDRPDMRELWDLIQRKTHDASQWPDEDDEATRMWARDFFEEPGVAGPIGFGTPVLSPTKKRTPAGRVIAPMRTPVKAGAANNERLRLRVERRKAAREAARAEARTEAQTGATTGANTGAESGAQTGARNDTQTGALFGSLNNAVVGMMLNYQTEKKEE